MSEPKPPTAQSTALVASLATEGGVMTVEQLKANRELMKRAMSDLMEPGVHYGTVPGTKKPTLLKPGAELLCVLFRVAAKPHVEDLSDEDCIRYRVGMEGIHIPSGQVIAFGVGECSTDEEKYKWREAKCRAEYAEAHEDRRRWKWKGEGDDNGVNQVRTNPADAANTVLKMAKKRAQVDLSLSFSAASDVFAQDLEDIADWLREKEVGAEGAPADLKPHSKSGSNPPKRNSGPTQAGKINAAQKSVVESHLDAAGIPESELLKKFDLAALDDLPFLRLNETLLWIKNANPPPPEGK